MTQSAEEKDCKIEVAGDFCHLHVHSDYSLLDGTIKIAQLIAKAKGMGHSHVALTDHGVMYGSVDFYCQAQKAGLTPIVGCEIYHDALPSVLELLEPEDGDGEKRKGPPLDCFHMVLLAKNTVGYKKLIKVVSAGYIEGLRDDTPIVPEVCLDRSEMSEGNLVALSSCLMGEFAFLVSELRRVCPVGDLPFNLATASPKQQRILKVLQKHIDLTHKRFGEGNYFIELIDNCIPQQKAMLPDLVAAARAFSLPLVASADAHYLNKEDDDIHALAVAIKNSLTENDIRERLKGVEFHLLDNEEFTARYSQWPEAIANTKRIAEMCSHVEIDMGNFYLPQFDLGTGESSDDSLVRLSNEGLQERYEVIRKLDEEYLTEEKLKEYQDRLDYELKVILQMGFPGYFLIVQDFINWAKQNDIPVGPGRGSGAGSLVAYALKITDIDPLPYNLIFERFLNPERVSMPDFDVDFCQWRRDEVIQYVGRKYGSENVAQITTYGKLMAKGAVKSVGRAMNLNFLRVDRFTKLFPEELNITLTEALEKEPKLKEEMARDDALDRVMQNALRIEGLSSHTSVHAAGIVISDGPMTNFVPVYTTDGSSFITQYEMKRAEQVGLVKFDFLGLKTLTVIKKACEIVHETTDKKDFNIETIPLDDGEVFEMVSTGNTIGVFQLESTGMQQLIKKLQPSNFEDVIALVALFRPGPLGSGMVDDFVERKHGRQEIVYPHPNLQEILKDTYGMILYQEQVQKIAAVLANYSLGEADLLRRAMGKKIAEEMAKQKDRFLKGAKENEIDPVVAEEIFDLMAEFAKYGFNKSHSAAYGLVSYQTAFMKTHFPAQFMAAIMTCDLDNTKKIVRYIEDCMRMGIKILPPSINTSTIEFTVLAQNTIAFGLAAIKGVGESVLAPIIEERKKEPFSSIADFAKRISIPKLGKKTFELLIQVGAFDEFGYPRKYVTQKLKEIANLSEKIHSAKQAGQRSLFAFNAEEENDESVEATWEKQEEKVPAGSQFDRADLVQERKLLGVFLSGHPLDLFKSEVSLFSTHTIKEIPNIVATQGKTEVSIVALVAEIFQRRTKTGKLMTSFKLDQGTSNIEAVMFEKDSMGVELPLSNDIILATGIIDYNFDRTMIRFNLKSVMSLDDLRQTRTKALQLELKASDLGSENLAKPELGLIHSDEKALELAGEIRTILEAKPGHTPVKFVLDFNKARVDIDCQDLKVELDEALISGIRKMSTKGVFYQLKL